MRGSAMPRITPLESVPDNPMGQLNIFRTLGRHPKMLDGFGRLGGFLLSGKGFPPRERELVILRTGWRGNSIYEWGQHVIIGKQCGLSDEEIARIPKGADAPGWSLLDRALLRATDELHAEAFVSDATWSELAGALSTQQLMDLVFTVGQYNLVSMALNSFGVQPEPGLAPLPRS